MIRNVINIAAVLLIAAASIHMFSRTLRKPEPHRMLLERIERVGKLQLATYHYRDVVEHSVTRRFLPNPRILLIATGRITACIDMAQAKVLYAQSDSCSLLLPEPTLCVTQLDLANTKIYRTDALLYSAATLTQQAYQAVEASLSGLALEQGIVATARENAVQVLTPLLQGLQYKKVCVSFE